MVTINDIDSRKLISARELYKEISNTRQHYYRWIKTNVKGAGIKDNDYFDGFTKKIGYRMCSDIFLSIEFAKSLCHVHRTKKALNIRKWLFEQELTLVN
jgi:phage anti-repressor protein